MTSLERLKKSIENFPSSPGVYLMKDTEKTIIYVGKAKVIKKRVLSYFRMQNSSKVSLLMRSVSSIDYEGTRTEYEALLLEHNFIKKYKPKFNILLKDDKTFPMIKISNEKYPRVLKTRRILDDGAEYFGPYIESTVIEAYLTFIERSYKLRRCRKMKAREKPCFHYHLGRCAAVCAKKTSHQTYMRHVQNVRALLRGKTQKLYDSIEKKMHLAAKQLAFEDAQRYRGSLESLAKITRSEMQINKGRLDYVHFDTYHNNCCVSVVECQNEKIIHQHSSHIRTFDNQKETFEQFLMLYYAENKEEKQVILPIEMDASVESFFAQNSTLTLRLPQSLSERSMIMMARELAHQQLYKNVQSSGDSQGIQALQALLSLPELPTLIEGFDIATSSGYHTVASMVCFVNGSPHSSRYRYFRIKTLKEGEQDDFHSLSEAVSRRYTRLLNEKKDMPKLILVDGGKGQVSATHSVLQALGLSIPLLGLAKKHEEIFLPHSDKPIVLDRSHPASRLLQAIRNEAHRFATTLRAKKQKQSLLESSFSSIQGVGPKTTQRIGTLYHSLASIKNSDLKTLAKTLTVSSDIAQEIQKTAHALLEKKNEGGDGKP